jgi:hypothetical protein
MITTKGQVIEINGKTEWLLFHRLTKRINPVDFLALTDGFIQFPELLYVLSYLILMFTHVELWIKFAIPACLYFIGQAMINFRFGIGVFKLFRGLLLFYPKLSFFIILATFGMGFLFLGWWNLLVVPLYLLTMIISVLILTSHEIKHYRTDWNKNPGNYDIFKNNAFLMMYKYFSTYYKLPEDISPTVEETQNQDWLKPYDFMRANWEKIESYFNKKAKVYWRIYLHI